jgi:acyl-ACP thioesterase
LRAQVTATDWPVREPFIQRRVAGAADLDEFGHVNNVRYIAWSVFRKSGFRFSEENAPDSRV